MGRTSLRLGSILISSKLHHDQQSSAELEHRFDFYWTQWSGFRPEQPRYGCLVHQTLLAETWSPAGATTLFGEYGQYNDQFAAGTNLCSFTTFAGSNLGNFCAPTATLSLGGGALTASSVPGDILKGAFVTGSEVQRWGLGVVQEIDSAAMHVFARWQHQE